MWEINNYSQLMGLLYSAVLGIIYCVIYDFLRAARLTAKPSVLSVFFEDLIFSVFCAISCFCFLLSLTSGEARAYIMFGIFCGFFVCRLTLSKILLPYFKRLFLLLRYLFKKINAFLNLIFGFIYKETDKLLRGIPKILKSFDNTLKKGLKIVSGLLYTKANRVD